MILRIFLCFLITLASSAQALDWNVFVEPTGDLKKCFLENVSPRVLSKLTGGVPEKRGLRKKAKKAYKACSEFILSPDENNKTAKDASSSIGKRKIKSYLGTAPLYEMVNHDNKINLIFFNGGPGWWGNLNSKNFLIRERKRFFIRGANVYLFPNKEKEKMSFDDRLEDDHINRIRALIKEVRSFNKYPIYLAGISRGAVSVGAFIAKYGEEVDGAILLSGVYYNERITKRNSYSMQEVIGTKPLTPILIIHHENDGCKICEPHSVQDFFDDLETSQKKLSWISGGGSSGSPHGPFHHHGYEDVEHLAVDELIKWASLER